MKPPADEPQPLSRNNAKRGLRRLGIVAAIVWFGFWWARAITAYMTYRQLSGGNFFNQFDAAAEEAWYRAIGSLIASGLYPIILAVAFIVTRWVWRGFQAK
jgi:hypothetical protein